MRYSSKSGFWAVAVLLAGAAAFGSACGGSGSSDRGGAGATATPGGATGTAGSPVTPGGGSTGFSASPATGGGSASCTPTGSGTAMCSCPFPAGAVANTMIDDFEDGAVKFKPATVMTASGYWDWSNDMTGTVMPASTATLAMGIDATTGAAGTTKSLHVSGAMHTNWGAALAAELNNGCPFDASAYGGISFWAKGTSTVFEGANKLLILVGMPEFAPKANGGLCDDTAVPADPNCYARHRVLIDLAPAWKQYTIIWTDLAPPSYLPNGPAFNQNRIRDIVFNASGPSNAMPVLPPATFDFSVDEIKFVAPGTPSSLVPGGSGGATGAGGASTGGASSAGAGGAAAGAGGASAGAGGASAGAGGAAAGSGGAGG